MADTYLQYENEDRMITARWHGGAYIELGYVTSDNEWHGTDVINVWDYANDEATIPFTIDAMRECVEEHLEDDEEDDDYEDEEDDDGEADPHGTIHPAWSELQTTPRFKIWVREHEPNEEAGWKYKLEVVDSKYQDSDGTAISSIAGGDSWQDAFARAAAMVDMALTTDHCIF